MTDSLLGKQTENPRSYAPEILRPVPRIDNRNLLDISAELPFAGVDVWHAYELSWLNSEGLPQAVMGRFIFKCESPNLIESKSLKLYLNSLNQEKYSDQHEVLQIIARDLSACAGSEVTVELFSLQEEAMLAGKENGYCLDQEKISAGDYQPDKTLLESDSSSVVEESLYSNLFRSNCPITGQPDWATITVGYRGPKISRASLLAYLVSYRMYNGYHEDCVEKIFMDISTRCKPEALTVQANFLRRGGLDINPVRSSLPVQTDQFRRFIRQ
ncbi:MAG: NADPH-dependent 7-cyano-7-deazaguanine reductase QueF [Gammaproteobacteria bacterium]|nr:NADPH-dependent 7-cyano-7-deazaguanine reductase QueF [Gammaproteobacteria bacterium]|tara:strand:+ start:937 stop:1749 length:813 start_codon:yes stop_codon:yes gene_type:complete